MTRHTRDTDYNAICTKCNTRYVNPTKSMRWIDIEPCPKCLRRDEMKREAIRQEGLYQHERFKSRYKEVLE